VPNFLQNHQHIYFFIIWKCSKVQKKVFGKFNEIQSNTPVTEAAKQHLKPLIVKHIHPPSWHQE